MQIRGFRKPEEATASKMGKIYSNEVAELLLKYDPDFRYSILPPARSKHESTRYFLSDETRREFKEMKRKIEGQPPEVIATALRSMEKLNEQAIATGSPQYWLSGDYLLSRMSSNMVLSSEALYLLYKFCDRTRSMSALKGPLFEQEMLELFVHLSDAMIKMYSKDGPEVTRQFITRQNALLGRLSDSEGMDEATIFPHIKHEIFDDTIGKMRQEIEIAYPKMAWFQNIIEDAIVEIKSLEHSGKRLTSISRLTFGSAVASAGLIAYEATASAGNMLVVTAASAVATISVFLLHRALSAMGQVGKQMRANREIIADSQEKLYLLNKDRFAGKRD